MTEGEARGRTRGRARNDRGVRREGLEKVGARDEWVRVRGKDSFAALGMTEGKGAQNESVAARNERWVKCEDRQDEVRR